MIVDVLQGMGPERRRLAYGLLLSLLFHALLLNLTVSGQGFGLAGLSFPWQARRVEASNLPELRAILAPTPVAAAEPLPSAQNAGVQPPVVAEPAMLTLVDRAPPPPPAPPSPPSPATRTSKLTTDASVPKAKPHRVAKPKTAVAAPAVPVASTAPDLPFVPTVAAVAPLIAEQPNDSAPSPTSNPDLMALARSNEATWAAPPAPIEPTPATPEVSAPVTAAAPSPASSQTATPPETPPETPLASPPAMPQLADAEEAAKQRAVEQAKLDAAQQDAKRQADRLHAQRQEDERQAAAQQDAARQNIARQETARQEAARVEGERQQGERQAAARQDAARQDSARQESARAEAARLAAKQAEADKREERLRAIGRQLNEEADRREAREAAALRSTSASTVRRGRLFGRADANAELVAYAEAWSRKIQLNMTFDMIREAVKQPHADPLVTVAIRSDGSVEAITFVRSSGIPTIDEAIRRIVQSQANYPAFAPALLLDYDVVEIRRTWHFDMAVRLY